MCCVAFVNFFFFFFFFFKEHTTHLNRRYHIREVNVKPDRMNERMKRKGQNASMREKKKRKTDAAESLIGEAETAVHKCFNGRFLRICFFADGVCTRNSISLNQLELEPFCFSCFHQK